MPRTRSLAWAELRIGVVTIVAIAIAVTTIVLLTGGRGFFWQRYSLKARFSIGALYGLYLLYLGLPRLMKAPEDKAIGYTVVVVICAIIVSVVLGALGALIAAPSMMGAMMSPESAAPRVTYNKDSPAGKLDDFAKKMEEVGKKMEAAEKSGDPTKQMEAAMGVLGAAMSGGKAVEPVQLDVLRPLIPDSFAGLAKASSKSERGGIAGLMTAKAEAKYGGSGGPEASLEITDTGGASGLMGIAAWMGVQGEREDDNRIERTRREGNRMVHEQISKKGGRNKYALVVAERFVVSAEGRGVDIGALKGAVASLDLGKLESAAK